MNIEKILSSDINKNAGDLKLRDHNIFFAIGKQAHSIIVSFVYFRINLFSCLLLKINAVVFNFR